MYIWKWMGPVVVYEEPLMGTEALGVKFFPRVCTHFIKIDQNCQSVARKWDSDTFTSVFVHLWQNDRNLWFVIENEASWYQKTRRGNFHVLGEHWTNEYEGWSSITSCDTTCSYGTCKIGSMLNVERYLGVTLIWALGHKSVGVSELCYGIYNDCVWCSVLWAEGGWEAVCWGYSWKNANFDRWLILHFRSDVGAVNYGRYSLIQHDMSPFLEMQNTLLAEGWHLNWLCSALHLGTWCEILVVEAEDFERERMRWEVRKGRTKEHLLIKWMRNRCPVFEVHTLLTKTRECPISNTELFFSSG